jgi:hypothetical protein
MRDESGFINTHHFLRISSFPSALRGRAALISIRSTAAEPGAVLEGLGGFLLLLLVWVTLHAILILHFLVRLVLNPFPT